ncbi:hypothetical protein SFC43_25760 [Bacteroides sp. CR5/BHMF/2]|nr:hypothetical protein [Bacteroides sp. CR5/BHMF/2]
MKRFIKYRPIQLVTFLGAFMLSLSSCELDNGDEANFEEFGADGKTYTLLLMQATCHQSLFEPKL